MSNLKKFCPKCNEVLIGIGDKYCEACMLKAKKDNREDRREYYRAYKQSRDNISDFYNTKEWRAIRLMALAKQLHLCQVCLAKKIFAKADMVHHIIPLRDDYTKGLELDNLICLCNSCHKKVHAQYDRSESDKQEMINILMSILANDNING